MLEFHFPPHLIHPLATKICKILNEHNYQAYIVGGCVRDLILGEKPKDWDITTDASPKKIMEIFPDNIPTGLQHGTVTVCMDKGSENHFEVTTFRIEGEYSDGRRPDEVFFVMNVEQDLSRRDLTINAIAYDPINFKIVDPFGGILSLKNKIIQAVGNPNVRFQEDGLRIMRVARFAARFGYHVDTPTFQAMKDNIETLKKVSRERITDELKKILLSKNPSYGLQILLKTSTLDIACPLLTGRQLSLLSYQDNCVGELETRLAFLYNKLPIKLVKEELTNLKFSNKEIRKTLFLMELVERFYLFRDKNTDLAYKSFMAVVKNHSLDSWEHTWQQFIYLIEAMQKGSSDIFNNYQQEIVLSRKEMLISGDDLLKMGISPGPQIKKILDNLYLEILKNPHMNNKEDLLKISKSFVK